MKSPTRSPRKKKPAVRQPVTRERALQVAMALADAGGLEDVTMRGVAEELGIEAMSLYHHVANKDAILDGMVDLVWAEIGLPPRDVDWKTSMRRRAAAVRTVLLRHPWAIRVMEARANPGAANLAHHDAVLGCLRGAGMSVPLTAHAYAVIDSFVYGHVHTELTLPFRTTDETHDVARSIFEQMPAGAYPHLVELTTEHVLKPGYAFGNELSFGLELILDGLEQKLVEERRRRH